MKEKNENRSEKREAGRQNLLSRLIERSALFRQHRKGKINVFKLLLGGVWAMLILFFFINRDRFSVNQVVKYTPDSLPVAFVFMMLLFALKSVSIFIYCGILYVACGIIFPFPLSVIANLAGTVVMVSLPYLLGKRAGREVVHHITEKHPKAAALQQMREENEFFFSFITHAVSFLPCDVLSLYMGAVGISYPPYLVGCILGLLPSIVTFPILGNNITNPSSPLFIVSAAAEVVITVAFVIFYLVYRKRKKAENEESEEKELLKNE